MAVASEMLSLGTVAPDFALPDPGGVVHTLDGITGEAPAVLVAFLCNHCPYVKHVAPKLAQLATGWQERGLAVVAVSSNDVENYPEDAPEHMATEIVERGYTFPYLYDESQDVARAYHAACTPDFFLFDGDRRLVYRGQFDDSRPKNDLPVTGADLDAAVDALLSGRSLDGLDQWPSLGCGIKWKPGTEPA